MHKAPQKGKHVLAEVKISCEVVRKVKRQDERYA